MTDSTSYWWSGPICGLGNRLIAFAALKACTGDREIHFSWSNDRSCPGRFEDVFKPDALLIPSDNKPLDARELITHGWEPLTIYSQLNERLQLGLSLEEFCRRFVGQLRSPFADDDITERVNCWRNGIEGRICGVHIRRTDRTAHHREQFRAFLRREQGLNRELPIYLSAMYGLLPASWMSNYENKRLLNAVRHFSKTAEQTASVVFTDDEKESAEFHAQALKGKLPVLNATIPASADEALEGMRKTTIVGALEDILRLSRCDAIAQGNRASTFSIVAAIIGAKPIITPEPQYPFWRVIKEQTGYAPNDPCLKLAHS